MEERIAEAVRNRVIMKGKRRLYIRAEHIRKDGHVDKEKECASVFGMVGRVSDIRVDGNNATASVDGKAVRFGIFENNRHDAFEIAFA